MIEEEFQARRGARLNPNQPSPDQQPDFEQSMVDELVKVITEDPKVQFMGGALGGLADVGKRLWDESISTPFSWKEGEQYEPMFNPDSMAGNIGRSFVSGFTAGYPEGPLDAMSPVETAMTFADVVDPTNVLGDVAKAAPAILKSAPSPDLMGFTSRVIPVDNIAGMVAGVLPLQAKKFFKDTVATTDYEETGKLGLPSKTQEPILTYHGSTSNINEVKTWDPRGVQYSSPANMYATGFYTGGPKTSRFFALHSGGGPQFVPEYDLTGKRNIGFDIRTGKDLTVSQGGNVMPVYLNLKKVHDLSNPFTDTALLDDVLAMAESPGLGTPLIHKVKGLAYIIDPRDDYGRSINSQELISNFWRAAINPDTASDLKIHQQVDDLIRKNIKTNSDWWEFSEQAGTSMMGDPGTSKELLTDILQNHGYDGQTFMYRNERAWISLPDVNEVESIIRDTPMYGSYRERVIPYAMGQSKDIFNVPSLIPEKMEQFYSNNPFR